MLGRITPGRLPTTQANLDLIKNRIKQVQFNMTTLDQKVKTGTIDSRQAGYLRRQLIGEVDELRRVIANSRLSTPSYKVPRDLQVYRGSKPAKKYVSYADSRSFMTEYDGVAPVNKMPSDWQATELDELDVPDVPVQTGQNASWPSHWPGQHSPLIMQSVMEAGKINGKQIIDPRTQLMKLNLNMVQSKADMDTALVLKSRYTLLYQQATNDVRFTFTDRTLINLIMGKIDLQISVAQQGVERLLAETAAKAAAKAAAIAAEDAYRGQDDTNSGNNEQTQQDRRQDRQQGNNFSELMNKRELTQYQWDSLTPEQQQQWLELEQQRNQEYQQDHESRIQEEERRKQEEEDERHRRLFESQQGIKLPAMLGRRRGNTMALGAMQAHDRHRNMSPAQRVQSRTQRQSYLTAERELTMAKARAGAKVNLTQELKKAPVTRPWSMQVSLPSQMIEEIHITLDSSLTQIGLTQGMFTQQAHNYIASIVNSLDSSMNPSERTEFVVERIMSEMVNRSALLKDNVRVDVRQNGWPPVNITPAETTSVDGLGSAFLKTKAAMGRLLG